MKQAVLSLSGGMDSSTVLLHLLANGYEVTAVSFNYGQKHNIELARAQELIDYLEEKGHKVNYQEIILFGLVDLLNSNLVQGGEEVPEGHYEEDNMKDTVVPNRNKMFSSIIQAVALSIANEKNCEVKSGNSQLNGHQKNIKDAILKGRVHWHEFTADGIWEHETRKQHLKKK